MGLIFKTEGYCWTRTGERQAAKMRERYLRAVLRQDVGYFDLHVTSTSDVITSVSSDSLVIQDFLSEKVSSFLYYVHRSCFLFLNKFFLMILIQAVTKLFDEYICVCRKLHSGFLIAVETHNRRLSIYHPPLDPWTNVRTCPNPHLNENTRGV